MTARLALTAQAEDLIDAYTAELAAAGATAWPSTVGGARAFCARYPVSCNVFRSTGRGTGPPSRSSAAVRVLADGHRQDERLGAVPGPGRPAAGRRIAARYYPALRARLRRYRAHARLRSVVGPRPVVRLAQLAALHGVRPAQVTAEQLDSGGDALLAAFARPGHPDGRATSYAHPWFGCAPRSFTPG